MQRLSLEGRVGADCGMMYGDGDLMLIAIQCLLVILSLLLIEERRRVVDPV